MQNWLEQAYRLALRPSDAREDQDDTVPLNWLRYVGRRRSRSLSADERRYFEDRAEAELALAGTARHPDAARSHRMLAAYYLDLITCASGWEEPAPARA
jgi:hypothetical protein